MRTISNIERCQLSTSRCILIKFEHKLQLFLWWKKGIFHKIAHFPIYVRRVIFSTAAMWMVSTYQDRHLLCVSSASSMGPICLLVFVALLFLLLLLLVVVVEANWAHTTRCRRNAQQMPVLIRRYHPHGSCAENDPTYVYRKMGNFMKYAFFPPKK